MRIGIYPGTFDPITNGHIDIILRSTMIFDQVVVAVTTNQNKSPLFTVEERIEMIRASLKSLDHIEIESFDELLVNYALRKKASALIRGLRATSDFEYEFQMALMNSKLCKDLITVFLMPNEKYTYLNSTIVKEVARLGGSVECFVSHFVNEKLKVKFNLT
ncbi:pantetheine-phosphate adenylyltransferase [candidate division KSB1 bacterium]|nr:pantetheine-phosphate adenylyltransferase [candidate division KSB1 bacterium]